MNRSEFTSFDSWCARNINRNINNQFKIQKSTFNIPTRISGRFIRDLLVEVLEDWKSFLYLIPSTFLSLGSLRWMNHILISFLDGWIFLFVAIHLRHSNPLAIFTTFARLLGSRVLALLISILPQKRASSKAMPIIETISFYVERISIVLY